MASSRLNILYILEILREESDPDHILSMAEIRKKLSLYYNVDLDRRTITSAINDLIDFGLDISTFSDNGKGYYLIDRPLEKSETYLLMDAIFSLSYIDRDQCTDLLRKIGKSQSKYQRSVDKYISQPDFYRSKRTLNKEVFLNIEVINEAIDKNKQIEFTYLTYGPDKKLVPKRKRPYKLNAYRILSDNKKYYLLGTTPGFTNILSFRLDFIKDIKILDEKRDDFREEELNRIIEKATHAFFGKPSFIKIRFKEEILNYVIDQFGTDIKIREDGDYYLAEFLAPEKGIEYRALQFLPYVEVIEPKSLRESIIESLKENLYGI
ncbi:WYL domain-containing protein [Anaerococcus murdochii]|uniref:WYL domain-containing protein n=1 Tax=Anaerococcus murdochii TaxID=411577 RepID=A0ABS7SZV6_9FIRM|nr:WYL domain-containing protein [Anaerococcus murdochii]MBZ2387057.1 WYL domain-containing protein [Anaerococcus murdochii]